MKAELSRCTILPHLSMIQTVSSVTRMKIQVELSTILMVSPALVLLERTARHRAEMRAVLCVKGLPPDEVESDGCQEEDKGC